MGGLLNPCRAGPRAALRALLCAGAVALCLLGCASIYRGRGDRAAARGAWDAAVESYQAALSRDGGNSLLRGKLEDARHNAARAHRDAGTRAQQAGSLKDAASELETSLRYEDHAPTRAQLEKVLAAKRRADAEQALVDAALLEKSLDLSGAREAYQRALALEPALRSSAQPRLDRLRPKLDEAASLASRAQSAFELGDLDDAEHTARRALALDSGQPAAKSLLQRAAQERQARELVADARDAEDQRQYDVAVERAREAQQAGPSDERRRLVERLERKAFDFYSRRAERAADREEWSEAIRSIELARSYGPEPDALEQELRAARYGRFVELGRRAERDQDYEQAIEHYQNAYRLRANRALADRIRRLQELVQNPPQKPRR